MPKMIKYAVMENNKPAKSPECKVHSSWDNNVFSNYGAAYKYAIQWLGAYAPKGRTLNLRVGEPFNYNGYDTVTIIAIEENKDFSPLWEENKVFETAEVIVYHNGSGEIFIRHKTKELSIRITPHVTDPCFTITCQDGELTPYAVNGLPAFRIERKYK